MGDNQNFHEETLALDFGKVLVINPNYDTPLLSQSLLEHIPDVFSVDLILVRYRLDHV